MGSSPPYISAGSWWRYWEWLNVPVWAFSVSSRICMSDRESVKLNVRARDWNAKIPLGQQLGLCFPRPMSSKSHLINFRPPCIFFFFSSFWLRWPFIPLISYFKSFFYTVYSHQFCQCAGYGGRFLWAIMCTCPDLKNYLILSNFMKGSTHLMWESFVRQKTTCLKLFSNHSASYLRSLFLPSAYLSPPASDP